MTGLNGRGAGILLQTSYGMAMRMNFHALERCLALYLLSKHYSCA